MFQDGRLVHPPRTRGQSINPTSPEMVTIIGSEILYRHKIPKLISATIAVVRSVIARTPNTITVSGNRAGGCCRSTVNERFKLGIVAVTFEPRCWDDREYIHR